MMDDIKIIEADIEELFKLMPEARYKVTIIAQRRRIQELENALVQKSKDKLDIKKAQKASEIGDVDEAVNFLKKFSK